MHNLLHAHHRFFIVHRSCKLGKHSVQKQHDVAGHRTPLRKQMAGLAWLLPRNADRELRSSKRCKHFHDLRSFSRYPRLHRFCMVRIRHFRRQAANERYRKGCKAKSSCTRCFSRKMRTTRRHRQTNPERKRSFDPPRKGIQCGFDIQRIEYRPTDYKNPYPAHLPKTVNQFPASFDCARQRSKMTYHIAK